MELKAHAALVLDVLRSSVHGQWIEAFRMWSCTRGVAQGVPAMTEVRSDLQLSTKVSCFEKGWVGSLFTLWFLRKLRLLSQEPENLDR